MGTPLSAGGVAIGRFIASSAVISGLMIAVFAIPATYPGPVG